MQWSFNRISPFLTGHSMLAKFAYTLWFQRLLLPFLRRYSPSLSFFFFLITTGMIKVLLKHAIHDYFEFKKKKEKEEI